MKKQWLIFLLCGLIFSIGTVQAADHSAVLSDLQAKYPGYYANGVLLVDDSEQQMYWYRDAELMRTYAISTAAKG